MPDLSPIQRSVLTDLFGDISASLSLSLSEQLNREVMLEAPEVQWIPIQSILERVDTVHQTVFSLSLPVPIEGVILLGADLSYVCVDLIAGNPGLEPVNDATDAQVESLSNAVTGLAHGLTIALTNTTGHVFEIETCQSHMGLISLPPVFALETELAQVKYVLSIPDVIDSEITLVLPLGFVQILAPDAQDADGGSDGLGISEDDLAAMLGELSSVGEPPAPKMGGVGSSFTAAPVGNFPVSPSEAHYPRGMELIMDIPLDVTVELGRVRMLIKDVLELASGSIVELDRVAGEPVDLLVNGRLIAKGEVVVIEDNFGLRLTEIISPADRVSGLGKGR